MFLADSKLLEMVQGEGAIVTNLDILESDPYSADSPVQPCSIDLRIGDIFDPGAKPGKPGSSGKPREALELQPGGTAVITTLEECVLPSDIGAIGFPPNSVSSKGILMTNPGHVDPGYSGQMSFTVINMGSEPYSLVRGNKVVTLLFFKLQPGAQKSLGQREAGSAAATATTAKVEDLLSRLSADFLNISGRVHDAAQAEEQKTRRWALMVPIITGLVAIIATGLLLRGEISDLKAETKSVSDFSRLERELTALRHQVEDGSKTAAGGSAHNDGTAH
jgi:dCTP deaminase